MDDVTIRVVSVVVLIYCVDGKNDFLGSAGTQRIVN